MDRREVKIVRLLPDYLSLVDESLLDEALRAAVTSADSGGEKAKDTAQLLIERGAKFSNEIRDLEFSSDSTEDPH